LCPSEYEHIQLASRRAVAQISKKHPHPTPKRRGPKHQHPGGASGHGAGGYSYRVWSEIVAKAIDKQI